MPFRGTRLKRCTCENLMEFNKTKCKALRLGPG